MASCLVGKMTLFFSDIVPTESHHEQWNFFELRLPTKYISPVSVEGAFVELAFDDFTNENVSVSPSLWQMIVPLSLVVYTSPDAAKRE